MHQEADATLKLVTLGVFNSGTLATFDTPRSKGISGLENPEEMAVWREHLTGAVASDGKAAKLLQFGREGAGEIHLITSEIRFTLLSPSSPLTVCSINQAPLIQCVSVSPVSWSRVEQIGKLFSIDNRIY